MQTDRIVRRKLSDEVLDRLLRLIFDGNLQPGDPMPSERELMARFGVGRPAIRETMRSLGNMGLVSISHGAFFSASSDAMPLPRHAMNRNKKQ